MYSTKAHSIHKRGPLGKNKAIEVGPRGATAGYLA